MLNPTPQIREPLDCGVVLSGGRHQLLLPSHEDLNTSETEMNKILMLKQYLSGIQEIHDVLTSAECRSSLCDWVRQSCSPESLSTMRAIIDDKIEQDAVYSKSPIDTRNNRIWAVKVSLPSVQCWSIFLILRIGKG
jgi:DNA mismatch repair protein MSH4